MRAQAALPYHHVKRLQCDVCKPLRSICTDQDPVFDHSPYQIEHPIIFDKFSHSCHDNLRFQAVVEMPDISGQLVPCALFIFLHPFLYGALAIMRATTFNAPAAEIVHSAHEYWLQNLDQSMVHILIRPLDRLRNGSMLLSAGVIPFFNARRLLFKTFFDHFPELLDALRFCLLHPCRAWIRSVVCSPMVGFIYFIYGFAQILI